MIPNPSLAQNVAPWDRGLRLAAGVGLILAAAFIAKNAAAAALVGALGGTQVHAGVVGY